MAQQPSSAFPAPSAQAEGLAVPARTGEDPNIIDLAWYMSSFDLRSGLTVVEMDFCETVPSALLDDDPPRRR